jgi:hypothetical protein
MSCPSNNNMRGSRIEREKENKQEVKVEEELASALSLSLLVVLGFVREEELT